MGHAVKNRDSEFIPAGLSLAEQAVYLLRHSGAPALVAYYIGSLPFALGLLYFWSDVSRNPMADQYVGPASAGLALLFVWMKYWQVRFCRQLLCLLQDSEPETWPLARSLATLMRQCALQATGVVVLSLSAIILLPMGWAYAFYQNATILDGPESKTVMQLGRSAVRQSMLWPGQNHVFLGYLSVFAVLVMANLGITLILLPNLLKSLLGIETVFTLNAWSMFNTTFFTALCVLTYLCIDPILKAGYVLRCFYGASRETGDDIRAALKPYLKNVLPFLVLALGVSVSLARAQDASAPVAEFLEAGQAISSGDRGYSRDLDQAIDRVLQQRRFAWRLPRENVEKDQEEKGWLASLFQWLGDLLEAMFDTVGDWIDAFVKWLKSLFPESKPKELSRGLDWRGVNKMIFYFLGVVLAVLLVLWLRRWWRSRQPGAPGPVKDAAPLIVDLEDERLSAQDLPTDRWLRLAAEMMEKRDYRSALRAFYLSVISNLADASRVTPARHKSNRDYYLELAQRAHAEPDVVQVFQRCMRAFEQAWYGMHPVSRDALERFMIDQKRIQTLVGASF